MASGHGNISVLLYGCNGNVQQAIKYTESIFLALIQMIMIIIAAYGNSVVVLAIFKNKKLQMPRNSLLCSLAFIDLLSPLVRVLPMAISTMKGKWLFGCACCITLSASGVFFCSASILHLCVITIERYITITYPLKSRSWLTRRRTKCALALIWFLALLMAILPKLSATVQLHFNDGILVCDFYLISHPQLSLYMALLYYCLPVVLMIIVYYRIYRKIVDNNENICTFHTHNSRHQVDLNRRMKQEWKAVKIAIVVIGMFFILWLPYFSTKCIESYHPKLMPRWIERFAFTCAYLNSCCNFIVYSIMNRKLRVAFKEFVPCFTKLSKKNKVAKMVTSFRVTIRKPPQDDEVVLHNSNAHPSPAPYHTGVAVISTQWSQCGAEYDISERSSVQLQDCSNSEVHEFDYVACEIDTQLHGTVVITNSEG